MRRLIGLGLLGGLVLLNPTYAGFIIGKNPATPNMNLETPPTPPDISTHINLNKVKVNYHIDFIRNHILKQRIKNSYENNRPQFLSSRDVRVRPIGFHSNINSYTFAKDRLITKRPKTITNLRKYFSRLLNKHNYRIKYRRPSYQSFYSHHRDRGYNQLKTNLSNDYDPIQQASIKLGITQQILDKYHLTKDEAVKFANKYIDNLNQAQILAMALDDKELHFVNKKADDRDLAKLDKYLRVNALKSVAYKQRLGAEDLTRLLNIKKQNAEKFRKDLGITKQNLRELAKLGIDTEGVKKLLWQEKKKKKESQQSTTKYNIKWWKPKNSYSYNIWSHKSYNNIWSHKPTYNIWSHKSYNNIWSHKPYNNIWSHKPTYNIWSHKSYNNIWSYNYYNNIWSYNYYNNIWSHKPTYK